MSTRGQPQGWLRRLAGHCWHYRRNVIIALGGSLLATLISVLIPWMVLRAAPRPHGTTCAGHESRSGTLVLVKIRHPPRA